MGNIKKTIRYFKRNGIKNTYYAVMERLGERGVSFDTKEPDFDASRSIDSYTYRPRFSIVVPVYETPEQYLRMMIESCLKQTYKEFELILADASKTDKPYKVISEYSALDSRVKYVKVMENKSISDNTNVGIDAASCEYIALLDHDDLLTEDALYCNALAICEAKAAGISLKLIYSDEDKCDSQATKFYDRHHKQKLNLDLLLSNNYICHLAVIDANLLKKLRFRHEYNGSQDHDLFLRVCGEVLYDENGYNIGKEKEIFHIKRVLYHWRCHENSTAFDPASKEYAYTAGKAAVTDFVASHYGKRPVNHLKHRGFYGVTWAENSEKLFELRPELGAVGGMLSRKGHFVNGFTDIQNTVCFKGMNENFTGHRHRAALAQEVYSLDIRTIEVSKQFKDFMDGIYTQYIETSDKISADKSLSQRERIDAIDKVAMEMGVKVCEEIHRRGKLVLYIPEMNRRADL